MLVNILEFLSKLFTPIGNLIDKPTEVIGEAFEAKLRMKYRESILESNKMKITNGFALKLHEDEQELAYRAKLTELKKQYVDESTTLSQLHITESQNPLYEQKVTIDNEWITFSGTAKNVKSGLLLDGSIYQTVMKEPSPPAIPIVEMQEGEAFISYDVDNRIFVIASKGGTVRYAAIKPDSYTAELIKCMRYYQRVAVIDVDCENANTVIKRAYPLYTPMRANPSIDISNIETDNLYNIDMKANDKELFFTAKICTQGQWKVNFEVFLDARL